MYLEIQHTKQAWFSIKFLQVANHLLKLHSCCILVRILDDFCLLIEVLSTLCDNNDLHTFASKLLGQEFQDHQSVFK